MISRKPSYYQRVKFARMMAPKKPDPHPDDDIEHDAYETVGMRGLLASTEKLLAVNRGHEEPDNRDVLWNDRFLLPSDMLAERVRLDDGKMRHKMMRIVAKTKSLKRLPPFFFDNYSHGLLVGNPLSQPLEEVNPLHIMEQHRRYTKFGPGGIGDPNAVTASMQAVDASQFGFIATYEGPESEKIGVDGRLAWGTKVGSDRRLYTRVKDRTTGRFKWIAPEDLIGKTLKLPD